MAPLDFKDQTKEIVWCFFDEGPCYETDGPVNEKEDFNAMKIAAQLRQLGDHYDETVIQPLIQNLQKAPKQQVPVSTEFSNCVESLCNTWVAQKAEVASEKNLLRATMALALYVKKNCPELKSSIQVAVVNFLDNRLANWIMQQGGWEQASSL